MEQMKDMMNKEIKRASSLIEYAHRPLPDYRQLIAAIGDP